MIEFSRPNGEITQLTSTADKILLFYCPDDRNIYQSLNNCPADYSECTRGVRSYILRYILFKLKVRVVPCTVQRDLIISLLAYASCSWQILHEICMLASP